MRTVTPTRLGIDAANPRPSSSEVAGRDVTQTLRPIRICFLIDELAAAGTETQLLALIRHLDRDRFRPYLCLLRGDSPVSRALEPEGCPVLRLGVARLCGFAGLARAVRFARFLRRERIDILQAYFPDSSYLGVPAAWLARVPHRLRTRNNVGHWMTPLHRLCGQALNRFATGTIANCEAARRALLADERPDPAKVVVLENGVDLARFRTARAAGRQSPDGRKVVGVVANLRPVKGLDVFLEAASIVSRAGHDVVFRVAGEGELRPSLERDAARRGLADRFELPGSVADVPGFLAGLDVAVLPSRAEGMSNAILEYMAAGKALVATAVGAASELIEDGKHGLLVPPDDAGRLAQAIGRLLSEPVLAQRLGEAARHRAWQRYSREAMVRRFEDYYQRLVDVRRAA
jgi:glycosyltransferase involved in cell wall biosynthesis